MKKALITGVTGQDGSYLAELLLSKGYQVVGMTRRSSLPNFDRIFNSLPNDNFSLVEGDLSDSLSVYSLVQEYQFDEIYNLAAQSHVGTSFKQPHYTFEVDALGVMYFLEAINKFSPKTKFYQASTSELFGKNYDEFKDKKYQNEETQFMPQSPYAVAKLAAHNMVRIYREGYNLHASCGILFNHESERRGEQFVTRKITKWIGEYFNYISDLRKEHQLKIFRTVFEDERICVLCDATDQFLGAFPKLRLGNLDAYRDWGHAKDYIEAMWMMLQKENPEDFVIATGETYSVRDFLRKAFNEINIDDFEPYVFIDPEFYRPAEVEYLRGCPNKAKEKLGWEPKVSFDELVQRMVWRDINGEETQEEEESVQQERVLQKK